MCLFDKQEEDLEAQISFLQGQINDLEAMSKYCAKMMNTHICEFFSAWSSDSDHFHDLKVDSNVLKAIGRISIMCLCH